MVQILRVKSTLLYSMTVGGVHQAEEQAFCTKLAKASAFETMTHDCITNTVLCGIRQICQVLALLQLVAFLCSYFFMCSF